MAETRHAQGEPQSVYATKYRTHTCGQLRAGDVAKPAPKGGPGAVTLAGFVDEKVADDAFLIRDCYGKTLAQVAPGALPYVAEAFEKLNLEDVVQITGDVVARPSELGDRDLPTGAVCVETAKIEVLSVAQPLPPELAQPEVPYEDRLAYRQLYLRRPEVQARLELRHRATQAMREFLDAKGFLEIETPHLFWYDEVATVPEPVPVGGGRAFALPSGPVVLNQYVKPAAFDRQYQFLRVTRREREPSPFHAQEHTSLDINLCYVDMPDFFAMVEQMLAHVWKVVLGAELKTPFKRLSYDEALAKYGSDKVDPRFGLEAADLPAAGPCGRAIRAPGGATLGEGDLAAAVEAGEAARPGWANAGAQVTFARLPPGKDRRAAPIPEGSAAKLFRDEPDLLKGLGAVAGDLVVVVTAGDSETASGAIAAVRGELGKRLGPIPGGRHEFVWVHTYPFLAKDARGNFTPSTVAFAGVAEEDAGLIMEAKADPAKKPLVHAKAFDLILDGVEIASGYIGSNSLSAARSIWDNLWDLASSDLVRLRAPIEAHRFGIPPHGGLNIGVERLFALMLGASGLDEVMYFPKDIDCRDPMLKAPAPLPAEAAGDLIEPDPAPAKMIDVDVAEEANEP